MIEKLIERLIKEEGYRQYPYQCTADKVTIGIGRNLEDRGISLEEARHLCRNDIDIAIRELSRNLPYFNNLDEPRKLVLIDMCFNLGINRLMNFRRFHEAMSIDAWGRAKKEMLDSLWAKQVGRRAVKLADIIETGIYKEF